MIRRPDDRPQLKPETARAIRRILPTATPELLAGLAWQLSWAPATERFAADRDNTAVVARDLRKIKQIDRHLQSAERAMRALSGAAQESFRQAIAEPEALSARWADLRAAVRALERDAREWRENLHKGRPYSAARLFAESVAVVLRKHRVRVTSGETSVFGRVLEVLLADAAILGTEDLHELTKAVVRQSRTRGAKSA